MNLFNKIQECKIGFNRLIELNELNAKLNKDQQEAFDRFLNGEFTDEISNDIDDEYLEGLKTQITLPLGQDEIDKIIEDIITEFWTCYLQWFEQDGDDGPDFNLIDHCVMIGLNPTDLIYSDKTITYLIETLKGL